MWNVSSWSVWRGVQLCLLLKVLYLTVLVFNPQSFDFSVFVQVLSSVARFFDDRTSIANTWGHFERTNAMYIGKLVINKTFKYLQLSVMINYQLPTGLSQNRISLLLPMSELPVKTKWTWITEREGKPHTSFLFFSFILVSHIVWYMLTFKETLVALWH